MLHSSYDLNFNAGELDSASSAANLCCFIMFAQVSTGYVLLFIYKVTQETSSDILISPVNANVIL